MRSRYVLLFTILASLCVTTTTVARTLNITNVEVSPSPCRLTLDYMNCSHFDITVHYTASGFSSGDQVFFSTYLCKSGGSCGNQSGSVPRSGWIVGPSGSGSVSADCYLGGSAFETYSGEAEIRVVLTCDDSVPTYPSGTTSYTVSGYTISNGCEFTLSSYEEHFAVSGGSETFSVDTGSSCPWNASCGASWIHITCGSSETGSGDVCYTVDPNTGTDRHAIITVGDQNHHVYQDEMLTYTLAIDIEGNGDTSPNEGVHTYDEGAVVHVEADPDPGWEFDHWAGASNSTSDSVDITMDEDKSLTAQFVETQDEDPPRISLLRASTSCRDGYSRVDLTWRLSDNESPKSAIGVQVRLDEESWGQIQKGAESFFYNGLASGEHTFYIEAWDEEGNPRSASVRFEVNCEIAPETIHVAYSPLDPIVGETVSLTGYVEGCPDCRVTYGPHNEGAQIIANDAEEGTASVVFYWKGLHELTVSASEGREEAGTRTISIEVTEDAQLATRDPSTLMTLVQALPYRQTPEEILSFDDWRDQMTDMSSELFLRLQRLDAEQGGILGRAVQVIFATSQSVKELIDESMDAVMDYLESGEEAVLAFSASVIDEAESTLEEWILLSIVEGIGKPLPDDIKQEIVEMWDDSVGDAFDTLSTESEQEINDAFDDLRNRVQAWSPDANYELAKTTLITNIPKYITAFKGSLVYAKAGLLGSIKQVGVSAMRDLGHAGFKGIKAKLLVIFVAMVAIDQSGTGDLSQEMEAARAALHTARDRTDELLQYVNSYLYYYQHIVDPYDVLVEYRTACEAMIRAYDSLPDWIYGIVGTTGEVPEKRQYWADQLANVQDRISDLLTSDCTDVFIACYGRDQVWDAVSLPNEWFAEYRTWAYQVLMSYYIH